VKFDLGCLLGQFYLKERIEIEKGFFKKKIVEEEKEIISTQTVIINRRTLDDFVGIVKQSVIEKYNKKIDNGFLTEALEPIYKEYMQIYNFAFNKRS